MEKSRLREVEDRLDALATSTLGGGPHEEWPVTACWLGGRAVTIERGLRRCADIPAAAAVHILMRSLADLTILLDWLAVDPVRRMPLWYADGELESARFIRKAIDLGLLNLIGTDVAAAEQAYVSKMSFVNQVRSAAGLASNAAPLPNTEAMAESLGQAHLLQLYTGVFRANSQYTHTSARSFTEMHDLGLSEGPLKNPELAQGAAAALFAHVLETASRAAGLGIEDECEQLQRELVV